MENVIRLSQKEFGEIINSRILFLIVPFFILISASYIYFDLKFITNKQSISIDYISSQLAIMLSYYGSLIFMIIGSYVVITEKKSLNVLITKPIYRDDIINGKLLCISVLIIGFTIIAMMFHLSILFFIIGDMIGKNLLLLISRLPIVMLVSFLCMLTFLSISMFIAVFIKDEKYAIFSSCLIWIILMNFIPNIVFSGYISGFLGYVLGIDPLIIMTQISNLSPTWMVRTIMSNQQDFFTTIFLFKFEIAKLLIYSVIATVLCYITFIRRDIV